MTAPTTSTRRREIGTGVILALITILAFALRVIVGYRAVFSQDFIAFTENDAWYHMRLVDGLVQTFPWRIWYDQYLIHPGGDAVNPGPMFDWLIAGTALTLGWGAPSPRLVDTVGAFTPPVLGALTVLPICVIASVVFSRRAGLWAAFCFAVMPSGAFIRSTLGFTDHHCAEVFFSTLTLMFLVKATENMALSRLGLRHSLLGGVALGAYLLTWGGGALFLVALFVWAGLESLIAPLWSVERERLLFRLGGATLVASAMVVPWVGTRPSFAYELLAMGLGLMGLCMLLLFAKTVRARVGHATFVSAVVLFCAAAAVVGWFVLLRLDSGLVGEVGRLSPWRGRGYVIEAAPLMRSSAWGPFPLWKEFTTSLPLAAVGLLVLARGHRTPERLVLVWGIVGLLATFGQVRFSYYLSVPVAILAGASAEELLSGFARLVPRQPVVRVIGLVVLATGILAPGLPLMRQMVRSGPALTADWFDALSWLRTNTPEPFGQADTYVDPSLSRASTYGVMNWWDYGYYVTRVARRVPISNPKQSAVSDAAEFYLADDPQRATSILLRTGARYVLVDRMMQIANGPVGPGFFRGIANSIDRNPNDYCEVLVPPEAEGLSPRFYCYPRYYRTMAVRLLAFAGNAVEPGQVQVIEISRGAAPAVPRVINQWLFSSYEDASRFVALRPDGSLRIASADPLKPCVPLEQLPEFSRVFSSVGHIRTVTGGPGPPAVQIFEFLKHR